VGLASLSKIIWQSFAKKRRSGFPGGLVSLPNRLTFFCKEVKVGHPEIQSFDFSRGSVLLVLRGCMCLAGMPNKFSDAVMMQVRVLEACQNYQNINLDVNFGGSLAVGVALHACALPE